MGFGDNTVGFGDNTVVVLHTGQLQQNHKAVCKMQEHLEYSRGSIWRDLEGNDHGPEGAFQSGMEHCL